MKSILLITALIAVTESTKLSSSVPGTEPGILEIACYKVKPEFHASFDEMSQKYVGDMLAKQKGYIRSNTYQSIGDPSLFVDVVWWNSLEEAKKAEEAFTSDARFKPYNNAIEKVIYYDYATMPEGGKLSYRKIEKEDVLEFSKAKIKSGKMDDYNRSRQPLMNAIALKYKELHEEQSYVSINDKDLVIGLLYWSNPDICPVAQKAVTVESASLYQPFVETFDETYQDIIFSLFKKIR